MKKVTFDKACKRHTLIMALGITVLVFLMLVNIAGTLPSADIPDCSNNVSNFNKCNETLKAYDKAIEINPQDSKAWNKKDTIEVHILAINDLDDQLEPPSGKIILATL